MSKKYTVSELLSVQGVQFDYTPGTKVTIAVKDRHGSVLGYVTKATMDSYNKKALRCQRCKSNDIINKICMACGAIVIKKTDNGRSKSTRKR